TAKYISSGRRITHVSGAKGAYGFRMHSRVLANVEGVKMKTECVQVSKKRLHEQARQPFAFMPGEAVAHDLEVLREFFRACVCIAICRLGHRDSQTMNQATGKPAVRFVWPIGRVALESRGIFVQPHLQIVRDLNAFSGRTEVSSRFIQSLNVMSQR